MSVVGVESAHNLIIQYMKALGYESNSEGICLGLANMGMQAILVKEMPIFDERFKQLFKIPVNELASRIEEVQLKVKDLVQGAAESGVPLKDFNVNDLLSEEENYLFDIPNLFDGIELYLRAVAYKHLFDKDKNLFYQNALVTAPLVTSDKLKNEGGIALASRFANIYNEAELLTYFSSLKTAIDNSKPPFNYPISLSLVSANHGISVGYEKGVWIFIDANSLPTKYITDTTVIAQHVLKALSNNTNACVSTEVYVSGNHHVELAPILAAWQQNKQFQAINKMTQEKAQRRDSYNHNLADLAILANHPKIIEQFASNPSLGIKPTDEIKGLPYLVFEAARNNPQSVKALLQMNVDEALLSSAFETAADEHYTNVLKVLISDPRFVINGSANSDPPLLKVMTTGNDDIVKILLADKRIDPNVTNAIGINPLGIAAARGNAEHVKLLLENPKLKLDKDYFKSSHPFRGACEEGYPEIIALFLKKMGVDPNRTYSNGMTAVQVFYFSVITYDHDTAKKLLSNNIATTILPSNYNIQELLYEACQHGHVEMVKDILNRNKAILTVPNGLVANKALRDAMDSGHLEVFKLLLKNVPPLNSFTTNHFLQTAALKDQNTMVDFLLTLPLVDPNETDSYGLTPLDYAAMNGNLTIVKSLLADARTDPNHLDKLGRSALMIAAKHYLIDVVAEMLKCKRLDPNIIDIPGNNAFKHAVNNTNYKHALLILSDKRVNVQEALAKAALSQDQLIELYELASTENNLPIIQALLDLPEIDVNGQIAAHSHFYRAIENDQPEIANIILQNPRFNLKATLAEFNFDSDVVKLMNFAIEQGKNDLLKAILSDPAKYFNGMDENDNTSLNKFIRYPKFSDALALLISNPKVDINALNQYQSYPLFELTANRKDVEGLKLFEALVKRPDLKPNVTEKDSGWTALHHAAYWGQTDVVKLLLSRKDIDLGIKSLEGETALDLAIHQKNPEIVALIKNYELKQKQLENPTVKIPRPLPVPQKKTPITTNKENVTPSSVKIPRPLPVPQKKTPTTTSKEKVAPSSVKIPRPLPVPQKKVAITMVNEKLPPPPSPFDPNAVVPPAQELPPPPPPLVKAAPPLPAPRVVTVAKQPTAEDLENLEQLERAIKVAQKRIDVPKQLTKFSKSLDKAIEKHIHDYINNTIKAQEKYLKEHPSEKQELLKDKLTKDPNFKSQYRNLLTIEFLSQLKNKTPASEGAKINYLSDKLAYHGAILRGLGYKPTSKELGVQDTTRPKAISPMQKNAKPLPALPTMTKAQEAPKAADDQKPTKPRFGGNRDN